jgi:glycosyltransferase involved in cell wall biosynthesis
LPPFGKIKRKILARLLGMANIIQSVSYDAQDNLVEFLPYLTRKRKNLTVIKNGIMIDSLVKNTDINKRGYRKEIGIDDDVFLFGFLGRFMPQKGFVYLIDAVEELSKNPQFGNRFKIIAVNDGAFIREYKSIITEKRLLGYFIFHGFIPNVNEILTEMDALVMPSLWEAFGLLAAEAFILGCPVIASSCIGLREVIKDTPAIVSKEKDSHSIAEAMIKFMRNPGAIKEKAIEFMEEARARFDSIHTARQLDNLFDELVQSQDL